LHYRGGPGDPHEAISGFSGILSYFRFYFLEEIGWSLVPSCTRQPNLKIFVGVTRSVATRDGSNRIYGKMTYGTYTYIRIYTYILVDIHILYGGSIFRAGPGDSYDAA
jgi:hypothetical protein